MTLTKGNRYRWRVKCPTGLIFEHDDVRVVIATAMQEAGLGWHPPSAPWFFSEATLASIEAARARSGARFAQPVRSPFIHDLKDDSEPHPSSD